MLGQSRPISAVHSQEFDRFGSFDADGTVLSRPRPLAVLVIDDSDDDFLIARRTLRLMDTFDVTAHHAHDLAEAKAILERKRFDVLLVDFCLGLETGANAIQDLGGRVASAVKILLTGMPGQDVPHIALRAGAVHCLNKNHLTPVLMETTIRSALHTHWLERRLQEAITDLELANRAMSEFFARVGHDLKAPLNAIVDCAASIAGERSRSLGEETGSGYTNSIMADSRYLIDTLDHLIPDALRNGTIRYAARKRIDLADIVRAVAQSADRERQRQGYALDLSLPPGRAEILGQSSVLTLALLNVVHDLMEGLQTGGTVRVDLEAKAGFWVLRLMADGTATPESDLPPHDDPACGPQPRSDPEPSSLADIIASHHGMLETESRPDGTRTVVLFLPIADPVTDDLPELTRLGVL